jgi:hypothetical protein
VLPDLDFHAQRDRLAEAGAGMLGWTGSIRGTGGTMVVEIGLDHYWPEIVVAIRRHGGDVLVSGVFNSAGRLHLVQFEARNDHEITTADLRWGGILHGLKEWEIVSRRVATQILSGASLDNAVFDARTPAEALRILDQGGRRHRPRKIRKRGEREELIRQVAAAYREEVAAGNSRPRVALAERFGYTPQHIGALLVQARKPRNGQPPLLGAAHPGKAGEEPADA